MKIYISKGLVRYKYSNSQKAQSTRKVHENLVRKLTDLQIDHIELEGDNIWCRDYLPVNGFDGKRVFFEYKPNYNIGTDVGAAQIREAQIARKDWRKRNPSVNVESSILLLDGGAIELCGTICLVSTRVFFDNRGWSATEIENELRSKLGVESVFFIPEHPYDMTGHVDGLTRLVETDTILINDLSKEYELAFMERKKPRGKLILNWIHSFKGAIHSTGLKVQELTYTAHNNTGMDACGVYMNYLKVDGHILMPNFNDLLSDTMAQKQLDRIYKSYTVHPIPASELAKHGGIINCITWNEE